MIDVSAVPTDAELRSLAALVPTYFQIALEAGHVVVTLVAPGRTPVLPLVTYEILPGTQRDYAGPRLAELLIELTSQVTLALRALRDSTTPALGRILQIANDPPLHATRAKAADGALRALTRKVHSAEAADWF